jgi:hypothetical protein
MTQDAEPGGAVVPLGHAVHVVAALPLELKVLLGQGSQSPREDTLIRKPAGQEELMVREYTLGTPVGLTSLTNTVTEPARARDPRKEPPAVGKGAPTIPGWGDVVKGAVIGKNSRAEEAATTKPPEACKMPLGYCSPVYVAEVHVNSGVGVVTLMTSATR